MFTGIIEGMGTLRAIRRFPNSRQWEIASDFSLQGLKLGDSIAVNGCCLTVTAWKGKKFSVDISSETLSCTNLEDFEIGDRVNLEQALRVGDRLGGHWVQGHVDGVGEIVGLKRVSSGEQDYLEMKVRVPKALRRYMVAKGSVTVDGVSLTINEAKTGSISLYLIPHTQAKTTLTSKSLGARVNLEADVLIKYLESLTKHLNTKELSS